MKKKFLIITFFTMILGSINIFAFGLKGGVSLGNGIQLGAIFGDTENSGIIAGIAVPITFDNITAFAEYYYDFLFIDTQTFNMGLEIGAGGRLGIAFNSQGESSALGIAYAIYPMIGLKFGVLQNKLDIYISYDPAIGNATAMVFTNQGFASADLFIYNLVSFCTGIRYHF